MGCCPPRPPEWGLRARARTCKIGPSREVAPLTTPPGAVKASSQEGPRQTCTFRFIKRWEQTTPIHPPAPNAKLPLQRPTPQYGSISHLGPWHLILKSMSLSFLMTPKLSDRSSSSARSFSISQALRRLRKSSAILVITMANLRDHSMKLLRGRERKGKTFKGKEKDLGSSPSPRGSPGWGSGSVLFNFSTCISGGTGV